MGNLLGKHLYCVTVYVCMYVACKMIMDKLQYAIKKEDPKKMIEVCVYIHAYVCMYECIYVCMYVCLHACVL